MVIAILIILNIPVYLFLGWLAFDSKANAADTFLETVVAVLKTIFVPYSVRVAPGMDTSGSCRSRIAYPPGIMRAYAYPSSGTTNPSPSGDPP